MAERAQKHVESAQQLMKEKKFKDALDEAERALIFQSIA